MDVIDRLNVVAPPTRESLADQVVFILKRFILLEDLAPGARIPAERRLADTLNVSRTVLREALSRLIGEGLLVRTSPRVLQLAEFNREALAASMSPFSDRAVHFRDLMELRYILEMGALPVIITKLNTESLADIEHWAEEYERRRRSSDPGHGIDAKFHVSLLRTLKNPIINGLLPLIEDQIREYLLFDPRQLRGDRLAPVDRVVRDHREIVDAIRTRNPVEAVAAMERHLAPYFRVMEAMELEKISMKS